MRRIFGIVSAVSFVVIFSAACGGGGGGEKGGSADTMTVSISGPTGEGTKKYTEGPINSYGYYDPSMEADIYPTTGTTWITLSSGVTGGPTMPSTVINIYTSDHATGPHAITGNCSTSALTCVSYSVNGQTYDSISSSGTVTIDSIGSVGQPVIGSFSAVVAVLTAPSTTMAISGTFNVKRDN